MTKEELVTLGLTAELAEKVVEKYGNMIPKERFDDINTRMKKAEADVSERDKQIDGLKKSAGDGETLKKQIEDLQKSNKEASEKYSAELKKQARDNAINLAFTSKKAKSIDAARAMVKFDDMDFDESNGLSKSGIAKIEANIKSNAWAYDIAENKPQETAQNKFTGITQTPITNQTTTDGGGIGAKAAASFLSAFQTKQ